MRHLACALAGAVVLVASPMSKASPDAVDAIAALESRIDADIAAYRHEREADRVLADAERALALREAGGDANSIERARALQRRADVLAALFRHEAASADVERASTILATAAAVTSRQQSESLLARGVAKRNLRRDFATAASLIQQALAMGRELAALDVARAELALAYSLNYIGDTASAGAALERAGIALEGAERPRHPLHADLAIQRSALSMTQGQPAQALEQGDLATTLAAEAEPYSASTHFTALYARGQAEQRLDNLDAAMSWFQRARALPDASRINGGYSLAMLDYSVCGNLLRRDDLVGAEPRCRAAVDGFTRLPQIPPVEAASAWNNLALLLRSQQRSSEASAAFAHSLAFSRQGGEATRALSSTAEINLATMRLHLGDLDEAARLAHDQAETLGPAGDFSPRTARTGLNLVAAARWAQGRLDDAFAIASQAERSAARVRRVMAQELDERRSLAALDNVLGGFDLMLGVARKSGRSMHAQSTWDALLDVFGVESTWAARRLASGRAQRDPALKAVWQRWKESQAALAGQRLSSARGGGDAAALRAAEVAFDTAEVSLARATATAGERVLHARERFPAVRAALPADASLVRFVESAYADGREYGLPSKRLTPHLLALVAGGDTPVRLVDLGRSDAVAAEVERWYSLVSRPDADAGALTLAARALHRRLWQPLAIRSGLVFIVPDATVMRVSFAALRDEKNAYLIDTDVRVHMLEHERQLLEAEAIGGGARDLLLAGAPAFDTSATAIGGECAPSTTEALAQLDGARQELGDIAALASANGLRAQSLVGDAASERAVREALPGKAILHFATHGVSFEAGCRTAPNERGVTLAAAGGAAPAPAVDGLAALAWSGARNASDSDDDGWLTSDEVVALDLDGVALAVLSACETALGPSLGREGIGGLRRAFLLAGARSVVMSLWRVDDAATSELMHQLYRLHLTERQGTAAALDGAMRAVVAARRARGESDAPYYWAGFVASGDWR